MQFRLLSSVSFFLTLILIGCASKPEVVFEGPPKHSSSVGSSRRSSVSSTSSPTVQSKSLEPFVATPSSASGLPAGGQGKTVTSPKSVLIKMTFVAQAPHANWDMPYQEACEEASLIIVDHYLKGTTLSADIADADIQAMVAWQIEHFGNYEDTTAAQVKQIAEEHLGLSARVVYDPTIDDIKKELAQGNPVLIPAAGRDLGNPYFSGEGPWYHMLVIVGYDSDEFITHDVGTRRGENYRYNQDVLYDAIHDWTGVKEEIRSGRKAMVVVTI